MLRHRQRLVRLVEEIIGQEPAGLIMRCLDVVRVLQSLEFGAPKNNLRTRARLDGPTLDEALSILADASLVTIRRGRSNRMGPRPQVIILRLGRGRPWSLRHSARIARMVDGLSGSTCATLLLPIIDIVSTLERHEERHGQHAITRDRLRLLLRMSAEEVEDSLARLVDSGVVSVEQGSGADVGPRPQMLRLQPDRGRPTTATHQPMHMTMRPESPAWELIREIEEHGYVVEGDALRAISRQPVYGVLYSVDQLRVMVDELVGLGILRRLTDIDEVRSRLAEGSYMRRRRSPVVLEPGSITVRYARSGRPDVAEEDDLDASRDASEAPEGPETGEVDGA